MSSSIGCWIIASISATILKDEKLTLSILSETLGVKDPIQYLKDRAKKLAITKSGWFAGDEEAIVQWLIRKNIKESIPGTLEYQLKQYIDLFHHS